MRALRRILLRIIFWSYERGTWPYDIAVAAIVLFVLLSPRSWFQDQPQIGPSPSAALVELLDEDLSSATRTYRVDARLLASPLRTPELQHDLHDAVRKNVRDLQGRTFQIVRIEPVRGADGTVVYYDVSVKP
jgi:hypothetical protein